MPDRILFFFLAMKNKMINSYSSCFSLSLPLSLLMESLACLFFLVRWIPNKTHLRQMDFSYRIGSYIIRQVGTQYISKLR